MKFSPPKKWEEFHFFLRNLSFVGKKKPEPSILRYNTLSSNLFFCPWNTGSLWQKFREFGVHGSTNCCFFIYFRLFVFGWCVYGFYHGSRLSPWKKPSIFWGSKLLRSNHVAPQNLLETVEMKRLGNGETVAKIPNLVVFWNVRDYNQPPPKYKMSLSRCWFYNIFYFSPKLWGRWTHFDSYFSDGLVQPPTSYLIQVEGWKKEHLPEI